MRDWIKLVEGYLTSPPDVVYHGSRARAIKDFEFRSSIRTMLVSQVEVKCHGFFFALTAQDAFKFGQHVSAYKITCRKPLISGTEGVDGVSAAKAADLRYICAGLLDELEDGNYEFQGMTQVIHIGADDLANPNSDWFYEFVGAGCIDWELLDNDEFVRRMIERGYDGTVVDEPDVSGRKSWFVVSPNQIEFVQEVNRYQDDEDEDYD